jgi:mannose-6-phosphate isomerase-like protein (cupin superfamily)
MKFNYSFLFLGLSLIAFSCISKTDKNKETTYKQLTFKKKTSDKNKKGYLVKIEEVVNDNFDYRTVLYTGKHLQLVMMSLEPGEDIGWKNHSKSDQFIRVESGSGTCLLNSELYEIEANDAIFIPAGARHNILNDNDSLDLKIYTLYAAPIHKNGISRSTKEEATRKREYFDGETTE